MKSCICKAIEKEFMKHTEIEVILLCGTKLHGNLLKICEDCLYLLTDCGCTIIDCHKIMAVKRKKRESITCDLQLNNPGFISCEGMISGQVTCNGEPISNVTVQLSSNPNIVEFLDPTPDTNATGMFSTQIFIPIDTPLTDVEIQATVTINGTQLTDRITIQVQCIECTNPSLVAEVPEAIRCNGEITGNLLCDGVPREDALIFFDVESTNNNVVVIPNPAITDENGMFMATITSTPGVEEEIMITIRTTVGGTVVTEGPFTVSVNCPELGCPCKFRLETSGGAQPGAQVLVIENNNQQLLVGTMNINVVQCGASGNPQTPCNPAVNNFNFTFNASNGDTYSFTQGRRQSISCPDENTAIVNGFMQLSRNGGPPITVEATITAMLNESTDEITWEIEANDGMGFVFETIVPFVAESSTQSFISDCPE